MRQKLCDPQVSSRFGDVTGAKMSRVLDSFTLALRVRTFRTWNAVLNGILQSYHLVREILSRESYEKVSPASFLSRPSLSGAEHSAEREVWAKRAALVTS